MRKLLLILCFFCASLSFGGLYYDGNPTEVGGGATVEVDPIWTAIKSLYVTNTQPVVSFGRVNSTGLFHNASVNYGIVFQRTNYVEYAPAGITTVAGIPAAADRSFYFGSKTSGGWLVGYSDAVQVGPKFEIYGGTAQLKFRASGAGHDDWWVQSEADNLYFKQIVGDSAVTDRLVVYGKGVGVPAVFDFRSSTVSNFSIGSTVLPTSSNTFDLGSTAMPFRDLYLGGDSVYMQGTKVLSYDTTNNVLTSEVVLVGPGGTNDTYLKSGMNVSELVNDAGYVTSAGSGITNGQPNVSLPTFTMIDEEGVRIIDANDTATNFYVSFANNTYYMRDIQGMMAFDIQSRTLYDNQGSGSIDAHFRQLKNGAAIHADWSTGQLMTNSSLSLDWFQRLAWGSISATIDWENCVLGPNGVSTWKVNQTANESNEIVSFECMTNYVQSAGFFTNGSAELTIGSLTSGNGFNATPTSFGFYLDGSPDGVWDYTAKTFSSGASWSFNVNDLLLSGQGVYISADIFAVTNNGYRVIDIQPASGALRSPSDGTMSVDFFGRNLYDENGTDVSMSWGASKVLNNGWTTYIHGNEETDGSWRLAYDAGTENAVMQVRVSGTWTNSVVFTRP